MKPRSAKAKGRRATAEVCTAILTAFPNLQPDDVRVVPTSVPGEDVWLSPVAAATFPYALEAKNVEKINVWSAIEQAETHSKKSGRTPLVVFRRNGEPLRVIVSLEEFLRLVKLASQAVEKETKPSPQGV
jgi:hypothetical protein